LSYTIDIGAAPANSDCAQLGQTENFDEINRYEIAAYRLAIIAVHGASPQGCCLKAQRNPHDFGTYRTLVLQVDDDGAPGVQAYAEAVEDGLGSWLEACIAPPVVYDGKRAAIERPQIDDIAIGILIATRADKDGRFAIPAFEAINANLSAAFPHLAEAASARLGPA
jgi:hypothetical protein